MICDLSEMREKKRLPLIPDKKANTGKGVINVPGVNTVSTPLKLLN